LADVDLIEQIVPRRFLRQLLDEATGFTLHGRYGGHDKLLRTERRSAFVPFSAAYPDDFESALSRRCRIILREGRGCVSLLRRALGIRYGRAARLIDFMVEDGIVGAYNGSSAREALYTPEEWAALRSAAAEGEN
jgi:DNA segregation ATPase FtsK/SpoIIIE-like protein